MFKDHEATRQARVDNDAAPYREGGSIIIIIL
jgi:hypothetical protein